MRACAFNVPVCRLLGSLDVRDSFLFSGGLLGIYVCMHAVVSRCMYARMRAISRAAAPRD